LLQGEVQKQVAKKRWGLGRREEKVMVEKGEGGEKKESRYCQRIIGTKNI